MTARPFEYRAISDLVNPVLYKRLLTFYLRKLSNLNKKTNPRIAIAMLKPFFLKKLITGPTMVPVIHTVFLQKYLNSLICPQSFCQFVFDFPFYQLAVVH